jgi:hypothetical protein
MRRPSMSSSPTIPTTATATAPTASATATAILRGVVLAAAAAAAAAAAVTGAAASTFAAGAFPWTGTVTLTSSSGGTLSWTLRSEAGGVLVAEGRSPAWTVVHRARPDGTPVSTTTTKGAHTASVIYRPDGASFTWKKGAEGGTHEVAAAGLWDGDALEVRLAGIDWTKSKSITFKVLDTDSEDGDVYEMKATFEGEESCAKGPCRHVKVALAGIKAAFGPRWHFWFGSGPGAPFLKFEGRIGTFEAK